MISVLLSFGGGGGGEVILSLVFILGDAGCTLSYVLGKVDGSCLTQTVLTIRDF